MMLAAASSDPRALWYMTRGFGLMALLLLTMTTVLGLTQAARWARPGMPRFVISALHRNGSLLALVAIAVHVVTAVLDSYAPVHLIDVFVPFASSYRPLWTGLGALSLDLMLAVIVTSLLRERIGYRAWRAVHWAAYASWPVAVLHGLGTGSDATVGWAQLVYVACTLAVVGCLWWRLSSGVTADNSSVRVVSAVAALLLPVLIAGWAFTGPLRPGWARRAGTPSSLLASARASVAAGPSGSAAGTPASGSETAPASPSSPANLPVPLTASFDGTRSLSGPDSNGLVSVIFTGSFSGSVPGTLRLVLTGQPADGGVSLTGSSVSLGPTASPTEYQGHVTSLDGTTIVAALTDGAGATVTATVQINDPQAAQIHGTLQVQA